MKLMHVYAKSNIEIKITDSKLKKLPKNSRWGVVTTIQHQHKIQDVLNQLEKSMLAGQVLGCNANDAEKINDKVDRWLFVGSGEFHPIQVALKTKKEVWLWNPTTQELGILDEKVIEKHENRKKVQIANYLHAKRVGIIVSTKIGQKNLMRGFELAKKNDKEYYVFACDELHMTEFENFPFIEFWVNTACPRIPDEAKNMVNIGDLIDAGILQLEKDPMSYEVPIWMSKMGLKK